MKISELFLGSFSQIYASSIILAVVTLSFLVALHLLVSRRKKGYFFIVVSLALIMAQYAWIIAVDVRSGGWSPATGYAVQVMNMISFLLINTGMFYLYNRPRSKHQSLFYGGIVITLLIASTFFFAGDVSDRVRDGILPHKLASEIYLFLLIFLFFYLIAPYVGQKFKYHLGLLVYLCMHMSHFLNDYLFQGRQKTLLLAETFLPVVYFFIVFLFVFGRIVELLETVYASSIRDGLTGLYNRSYFEKTINRHWQKRGKGTVLFLDIDNFKMLNDTKGHRKGDHILQRVAAIVNEETADCGIACRYGGEEIVALITDPGTDAKQVAERIRGRVEKETEVTVSIGISDGRDSMSPDMCLKQADKAMYASKKTGKNKTTRFAELRTRRKARL